MLEATFEQAYPMALRAVRARSMAAVASGAGVLVDREDIQQEGLVACWRALPRFDPSRASLRTFVERVVAARLSSLRRSARRAPASEPLKVTHALFCEPTVEPLEVRADVERVFATLAPSELELVLLLREHSPAETSRILRVPRSTLHDRIVRLRGKFIQAGIAPASQANGGRR
jgi:RNA polymerase sigma factor (sigma-70 family)